MEHKINNLILELNDDCNSNCNYCYLEKRIGHDDKSIDYFKDELKKRANQGIQNVDFTGGEATIAKHLIFLVEYTKKLGYPNRTLITNGRRLSIMSYLKKLVDVGINRVVISIDGPNSRISDAITMTPGAFDQTINGMENVVKLGLSLGSTIVITKQNYKHIKETVNLCIDMGAEFMNFQFILPKVDSDSVRDRRISSDLIVTYEESVPHAKEAIDCYNTQIKLNVHFIPFCYFKGYEKYLFQESLKMDRYALNYRGFGYNIGEHLMKGSIKTSYCHSICKFEDKCLGFNKGYSKELGIKELDGVVRKDKQQDFKKTVKFIKEITN
jgi:MoaA/NifB/PqqE/SkfB family radical SAM enzyme